MSHIESFYFVKRTKFIRKVSRKFIFVREFKWNDTHLPKEEKVLVGRGSSRFIIDSQEQES